jgi:ABC-type transporter Mla maintaining outer membrane lipid asymmetry permease subunit MlaE
MDIATLQTSLNSTLNKISEQIAALTNLVATNFQNQEKLIMSTGSNILSEQAQLATDLTTLSTAVTNLLAAFAAGTITAAQAAQILSNAQSEDSTVTGLAASINAVLNPPASTTTGSSSSTSSTPTPAS